MLLDVMFIHKEENNDIDLFKRTFQKLMSFEQKSLCLDDMVFNYSIQKSEAQKSIRLKVATLEGRSTKKEADNITALKNVLTKGKHRSDYHIVFTYDGASEYYCNKLSRFMSVFERKLREFIYLNVLDTYGKEWVKATLTDEIQTEVSRNERNKNRHIEMALDCFTFQDYTRYLFSKRSEKDPDDVIKEAVNILEGGIESNAEIIDILKKGEKLSLWDKLFKGFDIDFTEDEINRLREIRNDIMHNKEISDLEFVEYKKLLRSSIKKLDEGISNAEWQKYSPDVNIADVLYSLSETMQSMKIISKAVVESLSPALSEIQKMSQKLAESVSTTGLSEITKNFNVMLKKSYADIASSNVRAISESIATLQRSVVSSRLEAFKGLQASLANISMPRLKNTEYLNLGLKDYLSSIPNYEIKPFTQNLLNSGNLEFASQLENEDEDDTFKCTDDSDKERDGE